MKLIFPPFQKNIEKHGLIRANDTVIVGFSGGKDSVTLMVLLQELQKQLPFKIIAAYFNHRLRADAGAEEQWVRDFCAGRGIQLQVGGRDLRRFQSENHLNLEHAASLSRYDFFDQLAGGISQARVATAHSRSDLSETFFIKLFRGSGLQGLSAIYANKDKKIIRPLLIFSEIEILDFLKRQNLGYYQDPTNQQDDFLRNRIRHQLLPAIRKIEPAIEERIFRTVILIQDEFEYFQNETRNIIQQNLILGRILPVSVFAALHPALARHLIREYLRLLKGNLLHVGFEHIADFLDNLQSGRGLSLPGLNLRFEKGWIFPEKTSIPAYRQALAGTGPWPIAAIDRRIVIRQVSRFRQPADNWEIIVPASRLKFPLIVRSAQRSDKFRKIHAPYRQKVFEMIRSSGMPAALRGLCPLLENGDGEIICVFGSPMAAPFMIEDPAAGPFVRIALRS